MPPTDVSSPSAHALQNQRQTIELFYRAFSDHQPALLDEACTSDWQDLPLLLGQAPGPDGLKPIIRALIRAFPDLRLTLHDVIQEPGKAAVRAEVTGTHRDTFMGMAPTGKHIRLALHEIHHFAGERLCTTWHLEDWFGLFQQLGRYPAMSNEA